MTRIIKTVRDLPEWFHIRKYEKQLDAADWYREIRWRQAYATNFEQEFGSLSTSGSLTDEQRELLVDLLLWTPPKNSPGYVLDQTNRPIEALTKSEALYLTTAYCSQEAREFGKKLDQLFALWDVERRRGPEECLSTAYETAVRQFYKEADALSELQTPAYDPVKDIDDPFLSNRRPLAGHPVTIDTQYDDETILAYVKIWLAEKRKEAGWKLRKPISQNDFDDWVHFRVREAFDLEYWSLVTGTRVLDKVVAAALWPNAPDEMSPIEILRTTTRKKIKEVFQLDLCVRFFGQLVLERGKNFLLE